MANELVKEVEEVIDTLKLCEARAKIIDTLQRAREALSRKEEQAPTKEKDLTTPQERAIVKNKGEQDG